MMKLKIYTSAVLFVLLTCLLTSCRAIFYTPNRNPVPLFKNKGDIYIDASTNLANKVDLTAGYAISNNLAGYIGFGGAREQAYHTDSSGGGSVEKKYLYNGEMFNMGFGYFLNREQSENFRLEVFGDLAYGSFRNREESTNNRFFNGRYTRIGVMPNFGYTSSNNRFSVAYSIRLSRLTFANANVSDTGFWRSDINRLNNKPAYGLLEHGLTVRAGFEYVKFQTQFSIYHGLNADGETDAVPGINYSLMFGVVVNVNILSGR